jgi:hypothetical protein
MQIFSTLLVILIVQYLTNIYALHVWCAANFCTHEVHYLVTIHANDLYIPRIRFLCDDIPEWDET